MVILFINSSFSILNIELKYDIDTLVTRINEHLGELLIQKILIIIILGPNIFLWMKLMN